MPPSDDAAHGRKQVWWHTLRSQLLKRLGEKDHLADAWATQQEPISKSTEKQEEKAMYIVKCKYSIILCEGLEHLWTS